MVTTGAGPHAMLIEISKPLLILNWQEKSNVLLLENEL